MSKKEMKIWLFIIVHLVVTIELVRFRMNILGYMPTGSEWITSLTIHMFIHFIIKIVKYFIEEYRDIKRSEEEKRKQLLEQKINEIIQMHQEKTYLNLDEVINIVEYNHSLKKKVGL